MPILDLPQGVTVHYLDYNSASPVVVLLLHGLGATCESWQLQIPPLIEAGYRVIVPDARGFGKTRYPFTGTSIPKMAEDMADLLRCLEIGPVDVVGISMGGTIALQLALDNPSSIKKLVLINTFASLRPKRPDVWLYYAIRFLLIHTLGLPAQARAVARRIFPRPEQELLRQILIEQILQADPRGYRASLRALARFDVRQRLEEIQFPTLVITGAADTTVPLENQSHLVKGITGARQVVIQAAGHAVIAEQPEQINQILLDFLTEKKE